MNFFLGAKNEEAEILTKAKQGGLTSTRHFMPFFWSGGVSVGHT